MSRDQERSLLQFWGSPLCAILPMLLYVFLGGLFSVGLHYYSMKGLIVAAVVSLFAGFFVCKTKGKYWDAIVGGLAQFGNSRLILIFIVIGIFSKLLMVGQIGPGFIWLCVRLGISKSAFVVFTFVASGVISMGAGAPIAALFASIPIFYPAGILLGANPSILIGALISGIFFGDALSPSSQVINTTILLQHDNQGRPAELLSTLRERRPYIVGTGLVSIVLFALLGANGGQMGSMDTLVGFANVKGLWMLIPIAVLLSLCFKTGNLFIGLSYGIVTGLAVGLLTGVLNFSDIMTIDYKTSEMSGILFDGIFGMADVTISTILLYGLIAVAVQGGMMDRCCTWILSKKFTKTTRGAEASLAMGVGVINILLAGCVLPSILLFGDLADKIGQSAQLPPNRRSILLTAMATNVTSIIPINSAFVMGAVTIVNQMVEKNDYLPPVSPFSIFTSSYYCLLLTVVCFLWIAFGIGRKRMDADADNVSLKAHE